MTKVNSLKKIFSVCKVIVVASSKGGVGKSTTAVNVAVDFANQGLNVLLVDGEEDGSTSDWQDERDMENLTILGFSKSFPAMLKMYRSEFDVIVIDTAGVNSDIDTEKSNVQGYMNKKCLSSCDLILIPLDPSPIDVRKSARFFSSVESYVDSAMGQRKALMFLNKTDPRETLTKEARKILDGQYDSIPLAKSTLRDFVAFKKAEGEFKTVNEYAPTSKAAEDMRALQQEIITLLGE